MKVRCNSCGLDYDDVYRLTFCPHDEFQMRTLVVRPGKADRIVTSVEELRAAFAGWPDHLPGQETLSV